MVLLGHLNVIKKGEIMKELSIVEAKEIVGGGTSLTGAFLSSIKGCINIIFEMGQAVGGAIRRLSTGNLCRF